jgi:hypothetical protein
MSKLTADEKECYKTRKRRYPDAMFVRVEHMTVVFQPTCNGNGKVSWAICSRNDMFNKKRGKYIALERLDAGIHLPCRMPVDS